MKQNKEIKAVNPASLPYLRLLFELKSENSILDIPPVVQYFLNYYKINSPLEYIRNYVDQIKSTFKNQLLSRNYSDLLLITQSLGLEVIGSHTDEIIFRDRPFIGCQTNSTKGNVIYLANGISKSLARATLAHEIGHLAFSSKTLGRPGNLRSDYIEESLCDYGAARLLIDDSILQREIILKLHNNSESYKNLAERLIYLGSFFNVPRNYIYYRIFDVFSENNLQNIAAIIEWKAESEYSLSVQNEDHSLLASPVFSISQNSFIPHKKGFACRPRISSIIFRAFFDETPSDKDEIHQSNFFIGSTEEYVEIGTLKGNFEIIVCGMGKTGTPNRFVVSVFIPR